MPTTPPSAAPSLRLSSRAGFLLGFALSGFFDGILLHQILQWHHLLSGVDSGRMDDIGMQILADGLFHLLMYAIAAVGLWQLWKTRHHLGTAVASRRLLSSALIGFGTWHVVDAVLSHWILGIHRIRMDSDMPLFWDLLWLAVFGIAFLAAGWRMRGRNDGSGSAARFGGLTAWVLAAAVAISAPVAALPPAGSTTALVLFHPGTRPVDIFRTLQSTDARLIWADASSGVWALDLPNRSDTLTLYRSGAYLVSNSAFAVGCLAWTAIRP